MFENIKDFRRYFFLIKDIKQIVKKRPLKKIAFQANAARFLKCV